MRSSTPWLEGIGCCHGHHGHQGNQGNQGNQFDFGNIGSFSFGNFSFGNIINFGNIVIQPTIALQIGVAVGGDASVTQAAQSAELQLYLRPLADLSDFATASALRRGYS